MTIKIPSKSILDRPILNISNDNIYPEIKYTKQDRSEEYTEIGSVDIQYCEQTAVTINDTISDEQVLLYSGYQQDYKYCVDSNNKIYPKLSNDLFSFIGKYEQSDTDDVTPLPTGQKIYNLLIKGYFTKDNENISYKQILNSVNKTYNQRQIWVKNNLYVSSKKYLQNYTNSQSQMFENRTFVSFSNEQDALNYILYYYQVEGASVLDRYIVRNSRMNDIVVVDNGDSFVLYFLVECESEYRDSSEISIEDIMTSCSITFYAKEIVSNSSSINSYAKYSLPDNELLATQTKIADTDIYTQINNSIVKEFGKGKHSLDLTCLYMEYKDINGQVVYSGKDGNTIAIGDEIEPYYYTDSEGDLPIGTYPNGDPLQFIVYSSEIESDDGVFIKNHIKAIEKINANKMSLPYYLNFTGLDANGNMEGQLAFDGNIVAYAVGTPIITITTASDGTQSETIEYNYCNAFNYEYYGFEKPTTLYTYKNETEAKQNPFWYSIPYPSLVNTFFVEPNIVIPKTYRGKPVTKILSNAFIGGKKCFGDVGDPTIMYFQPYIDKFSSFEFGENVDVIGESAFCNTYYGVLLPIMSNINKTFGGNTYEKEYNMPNVKEIKTYAFERNFGHSSIVSFKGSKDLVIDDYAFYDCRYVLYEFSSKNISIGEIQNTNGLVFKNTVESVNLKSNAMSFSNSSCGFVFYHSPTANITLDITSQKTATEITIYTDNNIVKSFDWASKNYTVTFKSLSEWES